MRQREGRAVWVAGPAGEKKTWAPIKKKGERLGWAGGGKRKEKRSWAGPEREREREKVFLFFPKELNTFNFKFEHKDSNSN